ncbi:ribonuclease P protein subunit p20 [Paroedura picta]|uniref:ribonuclease P protein subunit p20 n=1 Tax=Paroedura picta TaxID=143630 RepID=UPI001015374E
MAASGRPPPEPELEPELELETEPALRRRRRLLRPPSRLARRRGDVFVNMQTDFRAQLSRCQKLLLGPSPGGEICIHGLGLAIHRAINIALQLEAAAGGALRLDAHTSTVQLAPLAEPDGDADAPPAPQARHNSAIHIRLRRAPPD